MKTVYPHVSSLSQFQLFNPCLSFKYFVTVQSPVMSNSVTPWTAAPQASLSFIISQSLLRLMSIELMMPSNHQNPKGLDHGSKDHIFGLKH